MLVTIYVKVRFTAVCNLQCTMYIAEHSSPLCYAAVCAMSYLNVHSESKFVPVYVMKACGGVEV